MALFSMSPGSSPEFSIRLKAAYGSKPSRLASSYLCSSTMTSLSDTDFKNKYNLYFVEFDIICTQFFYDQGLLALLMLLKMYFYLMDYC